jgi:hypothetical protein
MVHTSRALPVQPSAGELGRSGRPLRSADSGGA